MPAGEFKAVVAMAEEELSTTATSAKKVAKVSKAPSMTVVDDSLFTQPLVINLPGNDAWLSVTTVCGGLSDDLILANNMADWLAGGPGNDLIIGGQGADSLYGNDGADILLATAPVSGQYLDGGNGDDLLVSMSKNDRLFGGAGADILLGMNGADVLDGGSGDDLLLSGTGNDTLTGAQGNDLLLGGPTVQPYHSYALVVGINTYAFGGNQNLTGCLVDANNINQWVNQEALWDNGGLSTTVRQDSQATEATIVADLHHLAQQAQSGDHVLFFFSGHGEGTTGTLCTYDYFSAHAGITSSELTVAIGEIATKVGTGGQVVVALDSCDSGKLVDAFAQQHVAQEIVFSACSNDESSYDDGAALGGAFTNCFCKRGLLEQQADSNGDDQITTAELYQFCRQHVSGQTPQLYDGSNGQAVLSELDDDSLIGNGGADTLDGGIGSDTLYGMAGDDWLDGGTGADWYAFGTGDGNDTLAASAYNYEDWVQFGNESSSAWTCSLSGQDLWVTQTANPSDHLTIQNWNQDSGHQLNHFVFGGAAYSWSGGHWQPS